MSKKSSEKLVKSWVDEVITKNNLLEKDKAALYKARQNHLPDIDKTIADSIYEDYAAIGREAVGDIKHIIGL